MKKGWKTKTLGEVCVFDKAQGIHRGLPYVGLEHIESHTARFIGSSEAQPVKSSTFRFSEEHVLYGRLRPYLNKALAPDFEGHCSTEIFPLKPSPELSREYLLFWLLADETCDRINATCTGARMPRAQMNDVLGFEIPVPPLAEQQRIVGLLDEAFEGLATAKANAEKNLQNARALFESHLQSVFTQRGSGWVEKHLKEVCEKITDGTHQTPKYFDEGIVFLSSRNVTSGTIDWDRIKYIDTKQHLEMHKRVAPRLNDILLAKNGTTGVAAIVDRDTTFDIYVSLALLRALPVMRPRFLLHFINSPAAKMQFNKRLKGIGVPNLHLEEIREVRLAFPADLEDQDRVVDELDDLRKETQRLARLYEQKLAALEALKKSLLHQAFTGKLL
jgi:type I restriction enzyme S subunit